MATAETVDLGPPHFPKEESIKAFHAIESELKTTLKHLRHEQSKHEPQFFAAVAHLSDHQLTNFSSSDLKEVRFAQSAYGDHLFGKLHLPESDNKYIMFRIFIAGDEIKLHCIHMEEIGDGDQNTKFRAIFEKSDPLEWFNE